VTQLRKKMLEELQRRNYSHGRLHSYIYTLIGQRKWRQF
jgi:hypothetical protein